MANKSQPAARKRRRTSRDQLDVAALLNKKVTVGKDGREQSLSPFEVNLRAQVKKAIMDRSLPAIVNVLNCALKYDLVLPAPEPEQLGGVLIVPGRLTKESWAALFASPTVTTARTTKSK